MIMSNRTTSPGHVALVVGHPAQTGGMETFCRFLAETALAAGWRVSVALSGENIYDALQGRYPENIHVDPVNWLDNNCAGDRLYTLATVLHRRRWFCRTRPDVAVFVQSSNTPFRAAIVGSCLAGVPVISTHRTMAWPIPNIPSRRHVFGLLPGLGLYQRRMVFKTWLTGALASRVVYNSERVRAGYELIYRYPRRRGLVIPNAVIAVPDAPTERSGSRPPTIGYVGRIGSDKRLDVLLRAVAAMRSRTARVLLYGEGAEQPLLAELASRLGIAERVEWRGVTRDPGAAYADMGMVALCSPRESSSNMVLEAMAAGKAIVTTDAGGMPELVEGGRCGLCVPALDVAALTAALDAMAADADLRRQLGQRARLKAMREHDPRIIGRQWMAVLAEVAGRAPEAFARQSVEIPAASVSATATA